MPAVVLAIFFAAFLSANVYVWTRPIGQIALLMFALPAGIAFFSWMLWFVAREPSRKPPL